MNETVSSSAFTNFTVGTLSVPEGYKFDTVYMVATHETGDATRLYPSNFLAIPTAFNKNVIVAIAKITGSSTGFAGRVCVRYKK